MPVLLIFVLTAFVALLPVAVPWMQFVLTVALASGFAALGVGLLLRAGLISLGHALFFAFGAYTVAIIQRDFGINALLMLLLFATIASALAGVVVGAFMVRYRAIFFAMLNLAATMVFFALLAKLYSITGGTDGIRVATPSVLGMTFDRAVFSEILFYGALVLALLVGFGIHRYLASPMGQALSAVHTNEIRLEYIGVSVYRVLLSSYVISAALAGLGGAVAAIAIGRVLPEMAYWTQSGELLLMAVLGGITGAAGPFIGAVFLALVHTVASIYTDGYWNLIIGTALLAVIFFLPEGLYGISRHLLRRSAKA